MELTININSSNAAFNDGDGGRIETARILRDIAARLERYIDAMNITDINGNVVGGFYFEPCGNDDTCD